LIASVRELDAPRLFLCQDIGPGGMTVLRTESSGLSDASPMRVEFELPDGRAVSAEVRVAYDTGGPRWRRTGLTFVDVAGEGAGWLGAYVQQVGDVGSRR
jgi:hypothetical protein